MSKYLTRQSPGIELYQENEHDECYRHIAPDGMLGNGRHGAEAWKLDVGAECNRLIEFSEAIKETKGLCGTGDPKADAQIVADIDSLVQRVADFEELETE